MKIMKNSGLVLLAMIMIFMTSCRQEEDYSYQLKFITEDYKPFNYLEDGELTGLAPGILKEICLNLNIPFEVEVKSWTEAYEEAQTDAETVLFSAVLNSERKDLFKWAGPIASIDWFFYKTPQSPVTIMTLAEAKALDKIGVIADYAIEQYLVSQGFTNLVYCDDEQDGFNRLLNGEIDLFPANELTAPASLASLGQNVYAVKQALPLSTDLVYFAFNKNIPDDVVADFQEQIDRMKDNGQLLSLTQEYLHSREYPGQLLFYTEQYPPLTFRNHMGEITGFGTDIVREIMLRNHQYESIRLSTWSNGYQLALTNPNVCLFTMDRTEIREDLFQWVGPIGTNTTWFYTKEGSGTVIESLEDARALTAVGTVDSWFSTQYLLELGFNNLVMAADPAEMTEKLLSGEVDAFVITDVTFPDILRDLGYDYSLVTPAFELMSSDYYIAFSAMTPSTIVNSWQSKLEEMKSDGIYESIRLRWFPE